MSLRNDAESLAIAGGFREAVCVDTRRIYDSCGDKECIDGLQVYFTAEDQCIIDNAATVKAKKVEVIKAFLEVEPIPFDKGYYSVDITYFFRVSFSAYSNPMAKPHTVDGLSTYCKKVILYGSEGTVRTFSSDNPPSGGDNAPIATLQVVDPLVLATNVVECPEQNTSVTLTPPESVLCYFTGSFDNVCAHKQVFITLGLFSIVQLERYVQLMIPAYDFCLPCKECSTGHADPCELFDKVKFPTDEFFPPKLDCDDD